VATGIAHSLNAVNVAYYGAQCEEPAVFDPKFTTSGLDPGYVTYRNLCYSDEFSEPTDSDQSIIARWAAMKDTTTATEQATIAPALNNTPQITVPVLLAVGELDKVTCAPPVGTDCSTAGSVRTAEQGHFDGVRRLDAYVLPGAGHMINLALNTPDWYAAAFAWLYKVGVH
jgi:pimeloyl-ACP methyl ester carboxylesterase